MELSNALLKLDMSFTNFFLAIGAIPKIWKNLKFKNKILLLLLLLSFIRWVQSQGNENLAPYALTRTASHHFSRK